MVDRALSVKGKSFEMKGHSTYFPWVVAVGEFFPEVNLVAAIFTFSVCSKIRCTCYDNGFDIEHEKKMHGINSGKFSCGLCMHW